MIELMSKKFLFAIRYLKIGVDKINEKYLLYYKMVDFNKFILVICYSYKSNYIFIRL